MKTEKIKQLKNSAWIIRFIDESGKSFVRFVSNTIVKTWGSSKMTLTELKSKINTIFTDATVKLWEKADQKRLYINNNKGQSVGWYDFNTNSTGSKFSSMMVRELKVWFANGIEL